MTQDSYAATVPILVTDHARWQAAERFRRFDPALIEWEVRCALFAGRVSDQRGHLGLSPGSDPTCLYVWTLSGRRIYALRHDDDPARFVVTTTMRRKDT